MCTLNQAFSYKPDVQAVAATRDGYFPLPDVHRLLRFRAHVDEAQDVVKRSIRRGGSPRFQLSTGENGLLTRSAELYEWTKTKLDDVGRRKRNAP